MREQRFDHDPMRPAGFGLFGEALVLDYTRRADPATAVEAWMDSPEHRAVLLTRSMRYVGAGATRGDFEGERATLRVLQVGRPSEPIAPAFDSGSLRLPHLGDCTHDGQPDSHGHSLTSR